MQQDINIDEALEDDLDAVPSGESISAEAFVDAIKNPGSNSKKFKEYDAEIDQALNIIKGSGPILEKLDAQIRLQSNLVPLLFEEARKDFPNVNRSTVLARTGIALKNVGDTLVKRQELEEHDDIDCTSPKFQIVFEWILEVVLEAMKTQGAEEIFRNNVFNSIAQRLEGFEEKVNKRLNGISSKSLGMVHNPFIVEILDKIHNNQTVSE